MVFTSGVGWRGGIAWSSDSHLVHWVFLEVSAFSNCIQCVDG